MSKPASRVQLLLLVIMTIYCIHLIAHTLGVYEWFGLVGQA